MFLLFALAKLDIHEVGEDDVGIGNACKIFHSESFQSDPSILRLKFSSNVQNALGKGYHSATGLESKYGDLPSPIFLNVMVEP